MLLTRLSIQSARCCSRNTFRPQSNHDRIITPSLRRQDAKRENRGFASDATSSTDNDAIDRLTKASQRTSSPRGAKEGGQFSFSIPSLQISSSPTSQTTSTTWSRETSPSSDYKPAIDNDESTMQPENVQVRISYQKSRRGIGRESRFYTEADTLLDFDYAAEWPNALASKLPDTCFRCIVAARNKKDSRFLAQIRSDDRSDLFKMMHPHKLFPQLLELHLSMQQSTVVDLGIMDIKEVIQEWSDAISVLLDIFGTSGAALSPADYEVLLSGTKALRLKILANEIWQDLERSGIKPTIRCVNGYCGSIIWSRGLNANTRHNERNTALSMLLRQLRRLPACFDWHVGQGGPREIAKAVYTQSALKYELDLDTESYCNLIQAAAMEGNMEEIESILQSVWNIDVKTFQQIESNDESIQPGTSDKRSHVTPSIELLFTLANAYCINNDVLTGLRVVHHISTTHQLPITNKIWGKLLEYAYVLGRHKPVHVTREGQVSLTVMEEIWKVMTNTSSMMVIDPRVLDLVFSMNEQLQRYNNMITMIEDFSEVLSTCKKLSDASYQALKKASSTFSDDKIDESLSRANELNWLRYYRNRALARKWLFKYLKDGDGYTRSDRHMRISCVHIPNMLGRWIKHLPRTVTYYISTGQVELELYSEEESRKYDAAVRQHVEFRDRYLKDAERYVDKEWIIGADRPTRRRLAGYPQKQSELMDEHEPVFEKPRPPPKGPMHKQKVLVF